MDTCRVALAKKNGNKFAYMEHFHYLYTQICIYNNGNISDGNKI